MMNSTTPLKPRPPPGQQGSTPFRSASASRFRSSLVPMNRATPARTSRLTGKLATTPSYARDLFRTSTPQTTRTTRFAPNLPAESMKMTPSARKFVQKNPHGGMSSIASTELFKMRIPSPDPELSGEALSKEVPDDPSRKGTIYADQFLAHKCPSGFDDLQRRQFFCILDLRRLKYAANEIFAKKDWKLNIMNFAKEYEKSRGLIMLRYGLYEFKNVKPSEEVLKRWRATHNLPEPEPQAETAAAGDSTPSHRRPLPASTTSTKRKAEEDITPKDNALMTSTANQNKRRHVTLEQANPALTGPAPFKKSKRKADETDEPDENQPSKVQKSTPSAAKSKFESILNRTQSGNTSPLKRAPLASFGTPKPSEFQNSSLAAKSNPFATFTNGFKPATVETVQEESSGSVFDAQSAKSTPAKSTSNIFSYLSESSANSSSNDNGNADEADTESESEEEAGSQEVPPSDQPSATGSAGTNTPSTQSDSTPFSSDKPSSFSLFGQPNKGLSTKANADSKDDSASKGGLFGRVQMGSNGQPLRATTDAEEEVSLVSTKQPIPEPEQNKTPVKQPGDYTFNPSTTPISFGPPTSNVAKTPATISDAESSKEASKPDSASTAKPPTNLFGATATPKAAFETTATPRFGASNLSQMKADGVTSSLFSTQKSTPTSSNIFGGAGKAKEKDSSVPNESASIFGASTANAAQAVSLFGQNSKANGSTSSQPSFGNTPKAPSSLFGASTSTASPSTADNAKVNGSSIAKSLFDTPSKPLNAGFSFGASKPETTNDTNKASNGLGQETSTFDKLTPKPIFGSEGFKSITSTAPPMFGNSTTSANLFGVKSDQATPAEKKPATTATSSLFGNSPIPSASLFNSKNADMAPAEKKDEPAISKSIFGNSSSSTGPSFIFGGQSATPATSITQASSTPSMIFGANGNQTNGGESKKPDLQFGSSAGASSTPFAFSQGQSSSGFTFTAGGNGQSFNNPFASSGPSPSTPMFDSKPTIPGPSSTFTFGFGQQAPSTPNPAPASQGNPLFGASSQAGNGAPSFSFTSATPQQNNSNPFAPKPTQGSMGSFLQAGSDAFTGANSPFPAPSSIGTTPISGTPEPQTQNEGGEEASHEQISLTEGGPGEEDEIILHEVRAKAIKFVPVSKGGDEEDEKKSPWSTQGVGPLRVLKNKSTGTVRMLLRAEPRGHIALNKALISDLEYSAKEKTVNFAAASDNGLDLETWVLQVKKPESAQQLVNVLEANKGANKK